VARNDGAKITGTAKLDARQPNRQSGKRVANMQPPSSRGCQNDLDGSVMEWTGLLLLHAKSSESFRGIDSGRIFL